MKRFITFFHGFCMALADSVPGVSGGTIAFLMSFYDDFIGSLNALISGSKEKRIDALKYLIKLGIGWITGFCLAVLLLAKVFESNIYIVSSLFMGFIVFSIPIVIYEERSCLKKVSRVIFLIIGIAAVCAVTYFSSIGTGMGPDLNNPNIRTYLYVFICGAVAICAMILPGISGSTLMLIFGIYIPIINGIKDILHFDFHALPIILTFGVGIITGVISVIKIIGNALNKHRAATVYLILGLMIGSLYAIIMGPSTLDTPQQPLSVSTFSPIFFLIGGAVIAGMQAVKFIAERKHINKKL